MTLSADMSYLIMPYAILKHKQKNNGVFSKSKSIFPYGLFKLASHVVPIHKRCKFQECNKYVPTGKRGEFCSSKCHAKYKRRQELAEKGKKLCWRGVRRPGL